MTSVQVLTVTQRVGKRRRVDERNRLRTKFPSKASRLYGRILTSLHWSCHRLSVRFSVRQKLPIIFIAGPLLVHPLPVQENNHAFRARLFEQAGIRQCRQAAKRLILMPLHGTRK